MPSDWTKILDQANDVDCGSLLVRLAKMAVSEHQAELAKRMRQEFPGGGVACVPYHDEKEGRESLLQVRAKS